MRPVALGLLPRAGLLALRERLLGSLLELHATRGLRCDLRNEGRRPNGIQHELETESREQVVEVLLEVPGFALADESVR